MQTGRLRRPCYLPVMAELCLELREEIAGAHGVYRRCATHPSWPLRSPGSVAWAQFGEWHSARSHPQNRDGESISVLAWLAVIGETQPLTQKRVCSGSNVPKETLVKVIERNLVEHRARHNDRMKGHRGSAASPSKPGPTAVANTAAPHQTAEGGRTYTPLAQQRECGDLEESLVQTVVSYPLVEHRALC